MARLQITHTELTPEERKAEFRAYYLRLRKSTGWPAEVVLANARSVYYPVPYGEPDDPGAFDDNPLRDPQPEMGLTHLCARCEGHGGWILRRDAYGEGKHFKCSCSNCNGWGYVRPEDVDHVHDWDWQNGVNTGHCLTLYTCTGCGKKWEVDSSD